MGHVFLTAARNEVRILEAFLAEFEATVREAGLADVTLWVVDDLSVDGTRERLEARAAEPGPFRLRVVAAPTNLGNQGAMHWGLERCEVGPDDVLVTFDCDGEDDVRSIPAILALAAERPGHLVLVERGRRHESLAFKLCFVAYKRLFRALTRQRVIPNNFMLIPGRWAPAIRRSPLTAVHLAYGVLKLGLPHVATTRDRRPRYGGSSSQNLFTVTSHGLVGLMVFYEVVVASLFAAVFALAGLGAASAAGVALGPAVDPRLVLPLAGAFGLALTALGALHVLLLAAGVAFACKLVVYDRIRAADGA